MLHVGICLPKSCTSTDVNQLVDTMLNSRIFGEKYYLDERFSIVESKTIQLRDNFFELTMVKLFLYVITFSVMYSICLSLAKIIDLKPIHFRCVLILNFVFVTVGSLYVNLATKERAMMVIKKLSADLPSKTGGNSSSTDNNNSNSNSNNNTNNTTDNNKCSHINAVLNVDNAALFNQTNKSKIAISFLDRFFSCFCIVKNSEIITTESLGTDSIEVIHGMRLYLNIYIYIYLTD